jgi:hypothetical protein
VDLFASGEVIRASVERAVERARACTTRSGRGSPRCPPSSARMPARYRRAALRPRHDDRGTRPPAPARRAATRAPKRACARSHLASAVPLLTKFGSSSSEAGGAAAFLLGSGLVEAPPRMQPRRASQRIAGCRSCSIAPAIIGTVRSRSRGNSRWPGSAPRYRCTRPSRQQHSEATRSRPWLRMARNTAVASATPSPISVSPSRPPKSGGSRGPDRAALDR